MIVLMSLSGFDEFPQLLVFLANSSTLAVAAQFISSRCERLSALLRVGYGMTDPPKYVGLFSLLLIMPL